MRGGEFRYDKCHYPENTIIVGKILVVRCYPHTLFGDPSHCDIAISPKVGKYIISLRVICEDEFLFAWEGHTVMIEVSEPRDDGFVKYIDMLSMDKEEK